MFHAFDTAPPDRPLDRSTWIGLLSRAPQGLLESAMAPHAHTEVRWLRRPETGLMMVQGRAGGSGERFNLGEVTVTRCALRLPQDQAPAGVSYVLGRNQRRAHLAALADALLQAPEHQASLAHTLLDPIRAHLAQDASERQARAQSTKVEFFTVARESGSADGEGDGA